MRRKCLLESNEVRPFEVAGPMMKVQPVLNMVAKLSQPLRVRLGSIRLAGISLKRQTRQWNLLPNPSCHPVGETVGRLSLLPILCRTTVRMIQVPGHLMFLMAEVNPRGMRRILRQRQHPSLSHMAPIRDLNRARPIATDSGGLLKNRWHQLSRVVCVKTRLRSSMIRLRSRQANPICRIGHLNQIQRQLLT